MSHVEFSYVFLLVYSYSILIMLFFIFFSESVFSHAVVSMYRNFQLNEVNLLCISKFEGVAEYLLICEYIL
jgi:hypothetical protein